MLIIFSFLAKFPIYKTQKCDFVILGLWDFFSGFW